MEDSELAKLSGESKCKLTNCPKVLVTVGNSILKYYQMSLVLPNVSEI
jgi:hypothetical protein